MEDHYSSEDEEVFMGALSESELLRRRCFLGSNYNSPVTPRAPRFNQVPRTNGTPRHLPDVLSSASTSTPSQPQPTAGNVEAQSTPHHEPLDDSQDDVIILDASVNSNSIITLSDDDESFLKNEETCGLKSVSVVGQNESVEKEPPIGDDSENNTAEIKESEIERQTYESLVSINVTTESKTCLNESANLLSEDGNIISPEIMNDDSVLGSKANDNSDTISVTDSHQESFSSNPDLVSNTVNVEYQSNANKSGIIIGLNESLCNEFSTYSLHTTPAKDVSSSLIQDIDEFVSDLNRLNIPSDTNRIIDQSPKRNDLTQAPHLSDHNSDSGEITQGTSNISASISAMSKETSELQECATNNEKTTEASDGNCGKRSFDVSGLSNLEYSLNGVTDSILNISHGSSLPSPPGTQPTESLKLDLYEDISCEGEQLSSVIDSNCDKGENNYQEDLHMSVDEVDFRQRFSDNFVTAGSLGSSMNSSQPLDYPSAHSSYCTAYDHTGENNSTSGQFSSFQNYRDVSSTLDLSIEMDVISIKSNEENTNEADFEILMQNRQNSFDNTPSKEVKTKVVSKLPVLQNSKSLLRAPKFLVKPDTLKTSSYKFAKKMTNLVNEKNTSNIPKLETCRPGPSSVHVPLRCSPSTRVKKNNPDDKPFTKTPSKINSPRQVIANPQQVSSLTKRKFPSNPHLSINKTPAQTRLITSKTPSINSVSKTPAVNKSGIPRAVKSDSKVSRVLTPLKDNASVMSCGKSNLQTKNKYKNIISPVHAYIRSSPTHIMRKAHIVTAVEESPEEDQTRHASPVMSVPKVIQKLNFENVEGQENVNPNVFDATRDTLPCKVLEPALQVFWKENEQPQPHLPKMGEKLTKMLAVPKLKITIHEGRVNQPPKSKGVLVPNNENPPPDADVENLLQQQSNDRISVRLEKNVELP